MPLQIPREAIAAIGTLKRMPKASVEAFVKALESVPLTDDTDEMAKRIAKTVPALPVKALEALLDALYDIYCIRAFAGVDHSTFLDDLMDGIQNVPELAVVEKEADKLRTRLETLLNINTFNLISKAKRLQRDGERLYCDAKIISDIRPVFGCKPTDRPTAAVVTHTLRLAYHEGKEHKEFHIILDCLDLDLLSSIITRAQEKDTTLRGLLKEIQLPNLGV